MHTRGLLCSNLADFSVSYASCLFNTSCPAFFLVIMNYEVKSAEDSDFPRMHLVVVDDKSGNHVESPYHYIRTDNVEPTVVSIAFDNPYAPAEFNADVQFVMEVQPLDGNDSNPGAEFVGGGAIGCEHNKRVSARLRDSNGIVKLQINDPTSHLKVLAGWATGHEAVRLTHPLILQPVPENDQQIAANKEDVTADNKIVESDIDEKDLQGDDDGSTMLDDEIQEENLPKLTNASEMDGDIEADVMGGAENDDKDVKMDDEIQEEVIQDPKNAKDALDEALERQGALPEREATKRHQKSNHRQKHERQRVEEAHPEELVAEQDKFDVQRRQKQRNEAGDASSEAIHLNDDRRMREKEIRRSPKHRLDLLERKKKHVEKERKQGIVEHDSKIEEAPKGDGKQTFRQLYESDEFASGLHMNGYICGCIIFVSSFVIICILGRRREKGRRDL